jgi:DNA-binding NtrC family response regulator
VSINRKDGRPILGHVVVIEDYPAIRMLLEEALAELGYTSASFENAAQAMSYLVHVDGACDFMIVDQGLPGGMRGSEFIHIANERWPSIPSILTSGYSVDELEIAPSATCLEKPFTLAQLEAAISTMRSPDSP